MIGLVKLTYDWNDDSHPAPSPGCYIRPQGLRGPSQRAYLIHSARRVNSTVHPGRYALSCERMLAASIPDGAPVYPIYWYSRAKKRSQKRGV